MYEIIACVFVLERTKNEVFTEYMRENEVFFSETCANELCAEHLPRYAN